jgi:hypothetical protein
MTTTDEMDRVRLIHDTWRRGGMSLHESRFVRADNGYAVCIAVAENIGPITCDDVPDVELKSEVLCFKLERRLINHNPARRIVCEGVVVEGDGWFTPAPEGEPPPPTG